MPISKIKSSAIDANAITGSSIADGTVTSADLDTNIAIDGTLTVGDGSGNETLTILSGSTNEGYLRFADGTSGSAAYQGRVEYDHTNGKLNMGAGGTTPVTIDSSGNMGVGTNSPASILDVTDSSTNQPTVRLSTATAANYLTIGRDSSTGHYNFKADETGSSIQFYTDPDGTGPVNRMSINRYGYVTIPNQPAVQVSYSGGNISGQVIPLNANSSTRGGMTIDTVNNRVTVPVSGWYKIGYSHLGNQASAQVWIEVNGTQVQGSASQQTSGGNGTFSSQVIVSLSANDYIHWQVGGTYLIHGNSTYNTMYAHLLG